MKKQRFVYNEYKRLHGVEFQHIVVPTWLVSMLHGPYEGTNYDTSKLIDSNLLEKSDNHSHSPHGELLCIYGDFGYCPWSTLSRAFLK